MPTVPLLVWHFDLRVPLVLDIFSHQRLISFNLSVPEPNLSIPLSMVEDAVDDMYEGCTTPMIDRVKNKYMKTENVGMFADVWKNASICAKEGLAKKYREDEALTKDHLQAICVYTSDYNGFYATFNTAVRTERKKYGTPSFPYHSLHFLLTSAINILKTSQNYCHVTYRRADVIFTGEVNQKIRFGNFASSSYRTDLRDFGKKTCFEIRTCLGAYLRNYSVFSDQEQEVLIPPYEVFKIAKITKGPKDAFDKGLNDCVVLYSLTSEGFQSNLNCRAAGFAINWKKSAPIPCQQAVYLGGQLNSATLRACLSEPRQTEVEAVRQ
ncbi:ecto-ADP-ribosyltransferase 4-like, partial [Centroberyx affinis]|uniref:ecto-ADP-ribosyltransferase 4-like n=1 Tax=Centroberyx affinis TaxID=166261 RepID=UPI003A5BD7DE